MRFREKVKERTDAASRLQRYYRSYRGFSMLPKALLFRKNEKATMIQKYMKGYGIFHKMFLHLRKEKLRDTATFFDSMRADLMKKAAMCIQKEWRRYMVR